MIANELLAAAERLRRVKAGESLAAVYGPLCETRGHEGNLWLCDRAALADDWLAKFPADDAAPAGHAEGGLTRGDKEKIAVAIKGRLARNLKLLLDGTPAAPRPKRVRRPAPLVTVTAALEFTVPYRPVNESNQRSWRARSRRTKAARDVWWATLLWAGLRYVPCPLRLPFVVTLTRLGGRRWDSDSEVSGVKGVRDVVADWVGVDDGDERIVWAYGAWEPGPECGVRVRIEARGG